MRPLWLGVVTAMFAVFAGCDPPSMDDDLDLVAQILCRCSTFSPGEDTACIAKLKTEIVVTDACVQCVEQEAGDCSTDLLCAFSCAQATPNVRASDLTKEAP